MSYKRSIYAAADIEAGEVFGPENLRVFRPGHGQAPQYHDLLLGRRARTDIPRGTPISWEHC